MRIDPLADMTQARWDALSPVDRDRLRDLSALNPQLKPYLHDRVEVTRMDFTKARFWVGVSTGWRPCLIEVKTRRSSGGISADREYRAVRLMERGATMTKRDFVELAQLVRYFVEHNANAVVSTRRQTLARNLADYCAKRSPRFDRGRFLTACGVPE